MVQGLGVRLPANPAVVARGVVFVGAALVPVGKVVPRLLRPLGPRALILCVHLFQILGQLKSTFPTTN